MVATLKKNNNKKIYKNSINESASRSIWINTEIFLAPSRIQTHRGRVMQT